MTCCISCAKLMPSVVYDGVSALNYGVSKIRNFSQLKVVSELSSSALATDFILSRMGCSSERSANIIRDLSVVVSHKEAHVGKLGISTLSGYQALLFVEVLLLTVDKSTSPRATVSL